MVLVGGTALSCNINGRHMTSVLQCSNPQIFSFHKSSIRFNWVEFFPYQFPLPFWKISTPSSPMCLYYLYVVGWLQLFYLFHSLPKYCLDKKRSWFYLTSFVIIMNSKKKHWHYTHISVSSHNNATSPPHVFSSFLFDLMGTSVLLPIPSTSP